MKSDCHLDVACCFENNFLCKCHGASRQTCDWHWDGPSKPKPLEGNNSTLKFSVRKDKNSNKG